MMRATRSACHHAYGWHVRTVSACSVWHFFGPNAESVQGIGAEGRNHCDVGGVATTSDKHAAEARCVVARVEDVPAAIEISFEPRGDVAGWMRGTSADVAEVSGAIAGRDVERSTKGDGEMGVIATHADAFLIGFGGGAGRARVLIAESNAIVDEVANL